MLYSAAKPLVIESSLDYPLLVTVKFVSILYGHGFFSPSPTDFILFYDIVCTNDVLGPHILQYS